jgi:hypothetical protein
MSCLTQIFRKPTSDNPNSLRASALGLSKRDRKALDACIPYACSLPASDDWPKWEHYWAVPIFPWQAMKDLESLRGQLK